MTKRNLRGFVEDFRTASREDQALTPTVGAIAGVALAFAIERYGPEPDPADFAITTAQARASLLSALALVFTGLSIVLALTALSAGNMARHGAHSPFASPAPTSLLDGAVTSSPSAHDDGDSSECTLVAP